MLPVCCTFWLMLNAISVIVDVESERESEHIGDGAANPQHSYQI